MSNIYNTIIKATILAGIMLSLLGCSSIPYRITHVYATGNNCSVLSEEVKGADISVRSDVIGTTDKHYGPIILIFKDRTRIIATPANMPGERKHPVQYELTLPANPIKIANNGNCEVVIRYADNQIVWIYDATISQSGQSVDTLPNSWLGLDDGLHELDENTLISVLKNNPLYVYDKATDETSDCSNCKTYKDYMKTYKDYMKSFSNPYIFHNSTLRYVVCEGHDTLAYDKDIWSCGVHYGNPPESLKKDVRFIPREEKLPSHLGSLDPFIVTKGCSPLLRMAKVQNRRKNFIYVKDGLFVLAYNLLPRNYPIFKAMVENTFVVKQQTNRD